MSTRLATELAIYALGAGWWFVFTALGVGDMGPEFSLFKKLLLIGLTGAVGLAMVYCLGSRLCQVPEDKSSERQTSIILGSVCLGLFWVCSGCSVVVMWAWN